LLAAFGLTGSLAAFAGETWRKENAPLPWIAGRSAQKVRMLS
jgi:hypothetical protein